ncbi:MAG: NAD(P)/FAD-dependent oxidoreductase [Chloroflexota bacterium]
MADEQVITSDIIIVGAGPAGLSTALHLIQQDPTWVQRIIVLEKASHPRPKLCGGGLTRFGLRILHNLGFTLPLPLPQAEVDEVIFRYRSREFHVRGKPQFIVFDRTTLDDYLAKEAKYRGLQIHENEVVHKLEVKADGVAIQTSKTKYQAQVIIGADGSKGITRRLIKKNDGTNNVARVLESFISATEDDPFFKSRQALFDFSFTGKDLQGYTWDFPSWVAGKPISNRGIYDSRAFDAGARAPLPALLDEFLGEEKTHHPYEGHPIHWFDPRNIFGAERIILVGDAAGADPLFGEGIGPALGYGTIAAKVIQDAFTINQFSFKNYRHRVFLSPVGHYLLLRWMGAKIVYRFSTHRPVMNFLWYVGKIVSTIWKSGKI